MSIHQFDGLFHSYHFDEFNNRFSGQGLDLPVNLHPAQVENSRHRIDAELRILQVARDVVNRFLEKCLVQRIGRRFSRGQINVVTESRIQLSPGIDHLADVFDQASYVEWL